MTFKHKTVMFSLGMDTDRDVAPIKPLRLCVLRRENMRIMLIRWKPCVKRSVSCSYSAGLESGAV